MTDPSSTATPRTTIPADDPGRMLTVAGPDDASTRHISVVGDTYSILVSGAQTGGRYCLIDMLVPDGSGPPPHRHDFEEMFTLLEGELEFTFRGNTQTVAAPMTVNIPANAPHVFKNKSGGTVHMLCLCTPAGQEEFFMSVGVPMASRSAPPAEAGRGGAGGKGQAGTGAGATLPHRTSVKARFFARPAKPPAPRAARRSAPRPPPRPRRTVRSIYASSSHPAPRRPRS